MRSLIMLFFLLIAAPAFSVQPDEVLNDPALEARARSISTMIRCPVCQGETIDDSNATIAKDLRLVVRERLVAGDSDDQVVDYLVSRYGEFILFRPRASGANLLLWVAGPAVLLAAMFGAFLYVRSRQDVSDDAQKPLTSDEKKRLDDLLAK